MKTEAYGKSSGLSGKPNPNRRLSTCLCTFFNILCTSVFPDLNSLYFTPCHCAAFFCYTLKPHYFYSRAHYAQLQISFGGQLTLVILKKIMAISNANKSVLLYFQIYVCVCFINEKCSVWCILVIWCTYFP